LAGGAALAVPLAALAQDAGRVYRLGFLIGSPRGAPQYVAFFEELRRAGFIEGRNLVVDERGFSLAVEQLPAHAVELSRSGVDAIVSGGPLAAQAAQAATQTIAILSLSEIASMTSGASLARPNANTTGVSILASELNLKRQEILMDLLPQARRMAVLVDRFGVGLPTLPALVEAARLRGVAVAIQQVEGNRATLLEEIVSAVDAARASGAEALNVLASSRLNFYRAAIIERSAALRLPAIYEWPETAAEGGLIGYGASFVALWRQLAGMLVKILRGTRPADLPIEQPTRIALVVNRRTAAALGVTIPPTLLALADEVIE
jgi:putative ABC transport system substrate-binding protein